MKTIAKSEPTHCQDSSERILTDASRLNLDFDQRVESKKIDALAALSEQNIDLVCGENEYGKFIRSRRKHKLLRYFTCAIASAAMVLCIVAGTWHFSTRQTPAEVPVQMIRTSTPAGQVAVVDLPDGSQVKLNAGSCIEYPSTFYKARHIKVSGEAFFSVAHDADSPFVVSTGTLDIKVLGTKFNVRNYADESLMVSLVEGSVSAYYPGNPDECITLKPNECLVMTSDGYELSKLNDSDISWVEGYYSFKNETLGEIAVKLERYYGCKIVISDSKMQNVRFTGKFMHADGVMEILRILQNVHYYDLSRDIDTNTIYIN